MSTTSTPIPRPKTVPRTAHGSYVKPVLWALLGLTGITVLIFTDYPIFFHPNPDRTRLFKEWFLLFPHALAGVLATAIGPFQFSTRLRARNLPLHRLLGKIYVGCIFVAAPLVIALSLKAHPLMLFVGYVFSIIWFSSTLFALLTARNGHVQAHRRWMIRSYAFTLDFIFSRALNPAPSFASMSAPTFAYTLMFLAVLYLFIPDVYLSWKEITTKRRA